MQAALRDMDAKGVSLPEGVRLAEAGAKPRAADIAANLEVPPALAAKAQELREQVRAQQITPEQARNELVALIQEYQAEATAQAAEQASERQAMARRQRHLYETDAVYRAGIDELRKEAEPRMATLDKNEERLQAMAKELGITLPDDGRMAELRKAQEEAKRNGDDTTARDLEAQMQKLAEQQARALAEQAHRTGRDDLAKEAQGIAGEQKDAFAKALAGFDKATQLFIEAEQRLVTRGELTTKELEEDKKRLAKEREGIVENRDVKNAQRKTTFYEGQVENLLKQPSKQTSPAGATPSDEEKQAPVAAASPTTVQTPAPLVIHLQEEPMTKFDVAEASQADQKVPTTITVTIQPNSSGQVRQI
ncbi:coiled-coil domain-containing protein [Nitrospirillum pindoramense]|uniref:Uncharacterized protein n=1 Tax=Nitrospirillum amazonense TaxID=28077 RepID=A0A560GK62_9PROT|nr:hypothetical protein [Nitrospirillum amazonense]TWB34335.1 hypothetical protein FBZ90_12635 [Nitrospirillum amazonense]